MFSRPIVLHDLCSYKTSSAPSAIFVPLAQGGARAERGEYTAAPTDHVLEAGDLSVVTTGSYQALGTCVKILWPKAARCIKVS